MVVRSEDPVGRLVDRTAVFIAPTATLREVAERLWWQAVGVLVVGSANAPLGIISERDVIALIATGADPRTTAGQAMTTPMISVKAGDPVYNAASTMLHNAIRHVPVTDDSGRVTGVVSVRDLIPLLLDESSGDG
jgi:signal-transduction protein with cAMP-binding, CBS, and nucleotidyltransferase domain